MYIYICRCFHYVVEHVSNGKPKKKKQQHSTKENPKKNKQHLTMENPKKKTNNIQPWKTQKKTSNIQPWKTQKKQTTFNGLNKRCGSKFQWFFFPHFFFAGNCLKFEHEDVCALNAKMTCSIVKTNI